MPTEEGSYWVSYACGPESRKVVVGHFCPWMAGSPWHVGGTWMAEEDVRVMSDRLLPPETRGGD